MKPKFDKPQMVRGVIVVGDKYCGHVSADNDDCAVARTLWYRHDDDLIELENELEAIAKVYSRSSKSSGYIVTYEYRDYKEV